VQIVGGSVVEGGLVVSLQICQYTLVLEPLTWAENWAELAIRIGRAPLALVTPPGPTMVTPTAAEFDEQPVIKAVKSITAARAHILMCFPPPIASRFSRRGRGRLGTPRRFLKMSGSLRIATW
jgi:hypothetical protein